MTLPPRAFTLFLTFNLAHTAPPRPQGDSSTARCLIYRAALGAAAEAGSAVVVDATTVDVPMFAFGGLATYPKAGRDQPFQVSDSLLNALLAVNQHRQPLSECPANRPALQAVNSDTLAILFQGHHDGWERFRQR